MHDFTAVIVKSSYIFWLRISRYVAVYVRIIQSKLQEISEYHCREKLKTKEYTEHVINLKPLLLLF
jgi:hypothetical protein